MKHRLELRNLGYMYMIDDSYHSNPIGVKNALDVLQKMPRMKAIVTSEMTEFGEKKFLLLVVLMITIVY